MGGYRYISRLAAGPLDIVGDIHGEHGVLLRLLRRLGYRGRDGHPDGRTLVFVGDLIDRGPDSVAVVQEVQALVEAGHAQAILGNHELNLLVGDRKDGNGWFWPEAEDHDQHRGRYRDITRPSKAERAEITAFLETLPVALEREDFRVVHACWHASSVTRLREETQPLVPFYNDCLERLEAELVSSGLLARAAAEREQWEELLHDEGARPPLLPNIAALETFRQCRHPLKTLTSGLESDAPRPFYAGGKWRMNQRLPWWEEYRDSQSVAFGHYWRSPSAAQPTAKSPDADLFRGTPPAAWLGPTQKAMCVDWSVGIRYRERLENPEGPFRGRLGALRWPERAVVWAT